MVSLSKHFKQNRGKPRTSFITGSPQQYTQSRQAERVPEYGLSHHQYDAKAFALSNRERYMGKISEH